VGHGKTDSQVLILTTYDLEEYVFDALRAGASGFLLKGSPDALLAGIGTVARAMRCSRHRSPGG
jgi:DNA-binding NarL/FixJ family response regulator